MQVTLRKASVLQQAVQDAIKAITLKGKVSINEFQDPAAELAAASKTLREDITRITNLSHALANIRSSVGLVNAQAGVNGLLAELAATERLITRYTELTEAGNLTEDFAVVSGKVEKLKGRDEARYYGSSEVETGAISPDEMEAFKNELRVLRKRKQELNDKLLEINIKTTVDIVGQTESVLQKENLI